MVARACYFPMREIDEYDNLLVINTIYQLSVVFHAGAKQPLVNLRLLEHQRLALLVVGDGIVIDPTVHGRWSRMRRQIPAQILDGH